MSAVFDAHLRLLQLFADRIRTHEQCYVHDPAAGKQYGREIPKALVDEVDRLRRAGKTQREVIGELHIGTQTYTRILAILRSRPG